MLMTPPQSSKQAGAQGRPCVRALFVGPREHRDFQAAWLSLQGQASVERFATVDEAVRARTDGVELIVLAQARPGVFASPDVARLVELHPLARVVLLCGSLCEGEARSGHPPQGVQRMYWHQWTGCWEHGLDSLLQGREMAGLPATATEEERFLSCSEQRRGRRGQVDSSDAPLVAICCGAIQTTAWLADVCSAHGARPLVVRASAAAGERLPRMAGIDSAIWCGDVNNRSEAEQLEQFAHGVRPAKVIALLHFPRPEDVALARELGAQRVFSLPMAIDDLALEIR